MLRGVMKFCNSFMLVCISAVLLFLASCGVLGEEDKPEIKELIPPEEELIPLETGNYWVYDQWYLDPSLRDTVREEVLHTRNIIADNTKIKAYGTYRFYYKSRPPEDALISLKANGQEGHYFLGFRIPADSLYNFDSGLQYKYPATVGDSWESTTVLYYPREKRFDFGSTRTIELLDTTKTVNTPAGVFENCYVYKHDDFHPTSPATHYIYIKPRIGVVGIDSRTETDTTKIRGQQRLLEYQIN